MSRPTMKILYGPPGTGKTWQAAREAVRAIEPARYALAMQEADSVEALRQLHEGLVAEGRILWVTFHPSYSYEDFVEGYRPVVDDSGHLAYRVVDGPFKSLCLRARFETDLQIGDQLTNGSGGAAGIVVGKDAGGWVVQVKTDRADKVAGSIDKYVPRFVVNRILAMRLPPQIFSIPGAGSYELADYGIDPSDLDVPEPQEGDTATTRGGSVIRKIVAARTGVFSSSDLSNSAHIGSVVRRLSKMQKEAPGAGSSVALVIDEINRAEPSRVFGELLTLLEEDKREGQPEAKQIWLPYSKKLFSVPANVSIIGTMNTVDRSLTALDFAMRRRFEFTHVPAQPELVPDNYGGVNTQALLQRINNRVAMLLGSGYEFGHAFLMQEKLEAISSSMQWATEPDSQLRVIAHVMRANILPTLAEYLHSDWSKIRAIAGESRHEAETISLFESPPLDPQFMTRLPDDYASFEAKSLTFSHWWDPSSSQWEGARFHRFVVALAAGN
ncbi:GTPase subunit of restriction endonuclease [Pseudomonas fluorescens R124]|uniref:GTPase subunit of restriction endonuclease n=1 Tax=Pseudomonas fluorescens R124 TaxID=743713 RepID=A0A7U9CRA0_PSEFL|nr:AAA family ATPase [Pseudomonas fluorescens]EJZ59564.1 GTPase subunit of restriction endonuclease [Pseudomonas fluorescens R124]